MERGLAIELFGCLSATANDIDVAGLGINNLNALQVVVNCLGLGLLCLNGLNGSYCSGCHKVVESGLKTVGIIGLKIESGLALCVNIVTSIFFSQIERDVSICAS